MTRIVSLVLVVLSLSVVAAQEDGGESQSRVEPKRPENMEEMVAMLQAQIEQQDKVWGPAPATLAEAHERLEQILSAKTLAEIDAMRSEEDTIKYHFSLGLNIRNGWGLWGDSALAQHMKELGFPHPDYMSGVILETFWCKRHGRDFELAERAADCQAEWEESVNRVPRARAALRRRLMGLRFERRDIPEVPIVVRNKGLRVRFACPFRDGVFLTAYHRGRLRNAYVSTQESYVDPNGNARPEPEYDDFVYRGYGFDRTDGEVRKMKPGEDAYTQAYFFDPADSKLHEICVPEVNEVYAAVVTDERAWFGGLTDGKLAVTGIGAQDRITVPLPQSDEMPDLGVDGQSLMAVYTKTIYRLEDRNWTTVHSGDILLPRSSLPPLRYGHTVFFREEENVPGDQRLRLWWLTMAEPLHLSVLDRQLEVMTAGLLRLREVTSWSLTDRGDLWVCTGKGARGNCLLRRSTNGSWSVATVGSSVQLAEDWPDLRQKYQGAAVSAVRALPDDALLLAGRTGLYFLRGDELVQELVFALDRPLVEVKRRDEVVPHVRWRRENGKMVKEVTEVVQKAPEKGRQVVGSVPWFPNNVLLLNDGSYFVTTDTWEGAHRIRQDDAGQWTSRSIDEGDPVIW